MICIIIILILLYIIYKQNIEPFTPSVDDVKFFPWNDGHSDEFKHLPNTYYMKTQMEHDQNDGLIPHIYDYMGKDSHHYIFEAPILKKDEVKQIGKNGPQKSYESMLDRKIYLPDLSKSKKHYKELMKKDRKYINDPFKYPYRHPEQLGNQIVYDFSNSIDLQTELRERELRLRGFHRTILDDENDYNEMTFCNDINGEKTDFPCHKYGLKFNYDLENQMRLAKNNDYSASICCEQSL